MATDLKLLLSEGERPQSFRAVLNTLRKRIWLIAAIVVAVPALTGFVVSKQPKIFRAQTSLIIESSVPQYLGPNFKDVVELETSWWNAQETLQTELRVIQSDSQAVATTQALCDRHLPGETQPALHHLAPGIDCNDQAALERFAPALQGLVQVDPQRLARGQPGRGVHRAGLGGADRQHRGAGLHAAQPRASHGAVRGRRQLARRRVRRSRRASSTKPSARSSTSRRRTTSSPSPSRISRTICRRATRSCPRRSPASRSS